MTRRDDNEPHAWTGPHPRASEPTRVGIGPEHRPGRNGDTPPSASYVDDRDGPKTPPNSIVARIAKLEGLSTEDQIAHAYAAAEQAAEESAQAKAAAGVAARASHRTENAADRLDARVEVLHQEHVAIIAKLDGTRRELRAVRAYAVRDGGELAELKGRAIALDAAHEKLSDAIGQPPKKLDERHSQQGELTKEELVELEQGTGLAGTVGRLVAGQKRLERRIGLAAVLGGGAASAPSWAPVVVDTLAKIFGGH